MFKSIQKYLSLISKTKTMGNIQKAMDIVGLEKHEQDEIFKMLAVVLWLGNLLFVENDDGNAAISDPDGKTKKKRKAILKNEGEY